MEDKIVKYHGRNITLSEGNGIIKFQVDDPVFGCLEIDHFQRDIKDIRNYKKGDFIAYEGREYKIAMNPAILEPNDISYVFCVVTIEHPLVST